MQQTSDLYKEILSVDHWTETKLEIAGVSYGESRLLRVDLSGNVFSEDKPTPCSCVSREIDIEMLKPDKKIAGLSEIKAYARITDGSRYSEWISQGVYYIDSIRSVKSVDADGNIYVRSLKIHGYDAMLLLERDYPKKSSLSWPANDIDVVKEIAKDVGISVDERTLAFMESDTLYREPVQYPSGQYSCRETLGNIAAMFAGCFIISEAGKLRLISPFDTPEETSCLIDHTGYYITMGGTRIRV